MLLKRFYDDTLAQASYMIGCQATGEALVVDANRDVEQYIAAASAEHLRITHVTETHIHADFVSGSRELAARAGAQLLLSDEGGPDWRYAFAAHDGARLLHDGDTFLIGNIRVDVLHTPGHTPEHICFVITDRPSSDKPVGMLTGDFLFVGDVGRPDLLERAARIEGTMESSARVLFHSLRLLDRFPDYLQIWPGHGAGSACGKALGAMPSSTLGYERIANWAFGTSNEDTFVRQVLAGQPEPPKYFAEMKRINRDGPTVRVSGTALHRLGLSEIEDAQRSGAWLIDTRLAGAFAQGFLKGAINLPLNKSFTNWAGSLLPYDKDLVVLGSDVAMAERAVSLLALIGLDRVRGVADPRVLEQAVADGRVLEKMPQTDVQSLAAHGTGGAHVVDVRNNSEWAEGHIPGAEHLFLGSLLERAAHLAKDATIVVHCHSGSRSSIAASLLKAHGYTDVSNLSGGIVAWQKAGLPVATEPIDVDAEVTR